MKIVVLWVALVSFPHPHPQPHPQPHPHPHPHPHPQPHPQRRQRLARPRVPHGTSLKSLVSVDKMFIGLIPAVLVKVSKVVTRQR